MDKKEYFLRYPLDGAPVGGAEAPVCDALVDLGTVAEGVVGAVEHLRDRHQLEKRRDLPRGITLCELVVKLPELRQRTRRQMRGPAFLGKANEAAGQERQGAPAMGKYPADVGVLRHCAAEDQMRDRARGIGGVLNRARRNARNETAAAGRRRWMDIDDGFAPVEPRTPERMPRRPGICPDSWSKGLPHQP